MRPQLRVRIRRISVCEPRARQDRVALDTSVEALFAECEALQAGEIVFLCGTTRMG